MASFSSESLEAAGHVALFELTSTPTGAIATLALVWVAAGAPFHVKMANSVLRCAGSFARAEFDLPELSVRGGKLTVHKPGATALVRCMGDDGRELVWKDGQSLEAALAAQRAQREGEGGEQDRCGRFRTAWDESSRLVSEAGARGTEDDQARLARALHSATAAALSLASWAAQKGGVARASGGRVSASDLDEFWRVHVPKALRKLAAPPVE